MPPEGLSWQPRSELLTYEEIGRIVGVFSGLGIQKVRLTGGEPTVRADIEALIERIASCPGIDDIAMTTNGHTLAKLAPRLARAGLKRINVSLDTLNPDRFASLTRGGRLDWVLAGIDAARAAGIRPIKINAVLMRGENDHEVFDLVEYFSRWAADTELRFIEYMPFGERRHASVPSQELRTRLSSRYTLSPATSRSATEGPARRWKIEETGLNVGFISPLSEHFCATCNRLRLMCDGHLRTCLAHDDTPSLRDLVRSGVDDTGLEQAIRRMVYAKPDGHEATVDGGVHFEGVMTRIGG
jgi:cyclic pyranopterin phosphate synthase